MGVAVVTDSTAYLPSSRRDDVTVIPLPVTINGVTGLEGVEVTAVDMARAFDQRRVDLSTSRPAPGVFAEHYERLLSAGASGVVSVHLSGALSGTCQAAELAAREFHGRVLVVDSGNAGMGLGFGVLAAVATARHGAGLSSVATRARQVTRATETFFYVDTLEFLRRGGRIGAASALLGTALAVKPILHVEDGAVVLRDRVRTSARALARLVDSAVAAGRDTPVDVAVHHLASPDRAEDLLSRLRTGFGDRLRSSWVTEVGAVVAAHCGPGLLGVVVCRHG